MGGLPNVLHIDCWMCRKATRVAVQWGRLQRGSRRQWWHPSGATYTEAAGLASRFPQRSMFTIAEKATNRTRKQIDMHRLKRASL